jgi:hypothetical protein
MSRPYSISWKMMEAIYPNFKEDISVFEQVPCFAENAILLREVISYKEYI